MILPNRNVCQKIAQCLSEWVGVIENKQKHRSRERKHSKSENCIPPVSTTVVLTFEISNFKNQFTKNALKSKTIYKIFGSVFTLHYFQHLDQ